MYCCLGQSFLGSWEDGPPKNAEITSPVWETLGCLCTGYGLLCPFPITPAGEVGTPCFRKNTERYSIYGRLQCYGNVRTSLEPRVQGRLKSLASDWVGFRVQVSLFLLISSCFCSGNVSCVTLSRKLYSKSLA